MANFNSGNIPTEFPMTNIYHNVMVYFKKNESNECNDNELGTGTLYVTADMTVWVKKNGEGNGSPFYLNDINEESKKNDAIFAKRMVASENTTGVVLGKENENDLGNHRAVEEEEIVNMLAKYFTSVYEMNKDDGEDDNNGDEIPR
ncbi:hypothetical protein KQX54_013976 [Cotesia glomerata]|uniref:Uncharacterized protein n=1 Tax=Cotesia glomerata TaxID=32391 RepID=A0AAV7ISH3_COTGL|nr:hypothetical protein KQX54_013976 [Cotesia glomerata]